LAIEPWATDDEEWEQNFMNRDFTLQFTAFGRQKEGLKQQMISGMAALSLEERREIRKMIDDLDAGL
jgi:hypothetical protein